MSVSIFIVQFYFLFTVCILSVSIIQLLVPVICYIPAVCIIQSEHEVDERVHTYSLTYGVWKILFMMVLFSRSYLYKRIRVYYVFEKLCLD